jgi:hypothetical protein
LNPGESDIYTFPDAVAAAGDLPHEIGERAERFRVPDTFQLAAIFPFSAFLASRKIINLPLFNPVEQTNPQPVGLVSLGLSFPERDF